MNLASDDIKAVLWDFGGVITSSPFEAFERYEREHGYPAGFIRGINSTQPDHNAWARLERGEIGLAEFDDAFAAEARAAGRELRGARVLELLGGDVRPEMVEAVRRCRQHFRTACLTNNFARAESRPGGGEHPHRAILELFHAVFESSRIGLRKPSLPFYEHALSELGIRASEAVFLDDLGINLKPARQLGMRTIKVLGAEQALSELEPLLGIALRAPR